MDSLSVKFDSYTEFSTCMGNRLVHPANRPFSRSFLIFTFLPPAVLLIAGIVLRFTGVFENGDMIILILGGGIANFIQVHGFRVYQLARMDDAAKRAVPRKVTMDADGIRFEGESFRSDVGWDCVSAVTNEKKGIVIWIGNTYCPVPDSHALEGTSRQEVHDVITNWYLGKK